MYRQTLPTIALAGPTKFSDVLRSFVNSVSQTLTNNIYQILLILTDGEIHDMPQTIDLVIEASQLPCSIIIVGVGNEGFQMMKQLDADKGRLTSKTNGSKAARDIVQFVCFRDYANAGQ